MPRRKRIYTYEGGPVLDGHSMIPFIDPHWTVTATPEEATLTFKWKDWNDYNHYRHENGTPHNDGTVTSKETRTLITVSLQLDDTTKRYIGAEFIVNNGTNHFTFTGDMSTYVEATGNPQPPDPYAIGNTDQYGEIRTEGRNLELHRSDVGAYTDGPPDPEARLALIDTTSTPNNYIAIGLNTTQTIDLAHLLLQHLADNHQWTTILLQDKIEEHQEELSAYEEED